jgi:hypothetical protein
MIRWDFPPHRESPHVPTRSEYEPLAWTPPREGEPEARVLRWTCDCQPVVYELVTLGGARYIRRTQIINEKKVVHETDRWIDHVADGMWNSPLFGHVR